MALIAGIDVETSGLDFRKDKTLEVGAILWDTERNAPVHIFDQFINYEDLVIPPKITKLNSIDKPLLDRWGIEAPNACMHLQWLLGQADYALAFEAQFDKGFLYRMMFDTDFELPKIHWIDARYDIPYEGDKGKGKLTLVLAYHEILNYFPHRAFGDILCTCKMASQYSWDEIIRRANTPTIEIFAQISYEEKNLAKEAGFFWNSENKQWRKKLKEEDYSVSGFCFPTVVLDQPVIDYTC